MSSLRCSIPELRGETQQPHVSNYWPLKTIGKGNFTKVKLALHILTSIEVEIKITDKMQLNANSLQKLFRDIRILKILNHPNKYNGYIYHHIRLTWIEFPPFSPAVTQQPRQKTNGSRSEPIHQKIINTC
uniref:non-specific serine/threonine protein kinase n=1 Tax=Amphiprion percula TaxID=161767 RepID=A0A3P8TEB3_AMPPE